MHYLKGFVTVATGKEQYYILANNLLQSSADIRKGKLRYSWDNGSGRPVRNGYFIHFGTLNTLGKQSDGLYYREVYRLKHHPDWRRECKDRLRLLGRRLVNHSRIFQALANLFPKELRNKYNKV